MEEHRPEEERKREGNEEDEAVDEEHEQEEEEVTEGDLETFGGLEGGEEEELGVQCFICGAVASHPQLAVCLHSTCRSCAAETGGREGRVTCSRCQVSTPISALLPDYVHDRCAPSPPPSAHPSPPRLASLQSLLHRSLLLVFSPCLIVMLEQSTHQRGRWGTQWGSRFWISGTFHHTE